MATTKSLNKTTKDIDEIIEKKEENTTQSIDMAKFLEDQAKMAKIIEEQSKLIEMLQAKAVQPQTNVISLEGIDKVTVVHLKDYPTAIRLSSNKMILLQKLKQTQEITRSESLELVNSFPKAFEKGWITLTGEIGQQILETNSIVVDKETIESIFNYQDAINLNKTEMADYYDSLMPAQKDMFVSWWYNEAASDKPEFLELEVVNNLNKVSNGRFSKLIKEKITNVM